MPAQFLRGNLAALFTAVVWALTYAATKSLYEHVSPIDVIVLRFSVALVCLTGIAIAAHEPLRLRSAIKAAGTAAPRIAVVLPGTQWEAAGEGRSAQHYAITLLDALCVSLLP